MISRRTTMLLASILQYRFSKTTRTYNSNSRQHHTTVTLKTAEMYDYLYEHDYASWLCNGARNIKYYQERGVKDYILRLHTGETQYEATKDWNWEQRRRLGQRLLRDLAEDVINDISLFPQDEVEELRQSLELDGYVYRDRRLLYPESDVLDTQEEEGVLGALYASLKLRNSDLAMHHLKLSEEHYLGKRWDDAISNARKFLEVVLQEVAFAHSSRVKKAPLPDKTLERPVEVRDYLEKEGLLEAKEKEALRTAYGLLSHTGGHPYMAQNDQARLLRHLALTFSQFVMLRLEGNLKTTPAQP